MQSVEKVDFVPTARIPKGFTGEVAFTQRSLVLGWRSLGTVVRMCMAQPTLSHPCDWWALKCIGDSWPSQRKGGGHTRAVEGRWGWKRRLGWSTEGLESLNCIPQAVGSHGKVLKRGVIQCNGLPTEHKTVGFNKGGRCLFQPENSHSPAVSRNHRTLAIVGQIYQCAVWVSQHLEQLIFMGRNIWAGNMTWKRLSLVKKRKLHLLPSPI